MPAVRSWLRQRLIHFPFLVQVGHWLGLLHTFAGGCDPSTGGDFVADTRASAVADYVCTPINTCPLLNGTDPIHNYMECVWWFF